MRKVEVYRTSPLSDTSTHDQHTRLAPRKRRKIDREMMREDKKYDDDRVPSSQPRSLFVSPPSSPPLSPSSLTRSSSTGSLSLSISVSDGQSDVDNQASTVLTHTHTLSHVVGAASDHVSPTRSGHRSSTPITCACVGLCECGPCSHPYPSLPPSPTLGHGFRPHLSHQLL